MGGRLQLVWWCLPHGRGVGGGGGGGGGVELQCRGHWTLPQLCTSHFHWETNNLLSRTISWDWPSWLSVGNFPMVTGTGTGLTSLGHAVSQQPPICFYLSYLHFFSKTFEDILEGILVNKNVPKCLLTTTSWGGFYWPDDVFRILNWPRASDSLIVSIPEYEASLVTIAFSRLVLSVVLSMYWF